MKKTILIFLMISWNFCFGQNTFQKTYGGIYGEFGECVRRTSDNGYIICGYGDSFGTDNDIFVVKTDEYGNVQWTRTYGMQGADEGYSIQQTFEGGYVLCGAASYGAGDFYILKINSVGDTMWAKTYGGAYNDYLLSIQQTSDSGFIATGSYGATPALNDIFLLKTNSNGDTLWTKRYDSGGGEVGNYVCQTTDGGYIITGVTSNNIRNVFLIKTDSNGDTLWTKIYGAATTGYLQGNCVQQTFDGGYIVAGYTASFGFGDYDAYLIRTNSTGDTIWTRTYGGFSDDFAFSVIQSHDSGFVVSGATRTFGNGGSGSFYGDVYLFKTDLNGDTLWTHAYGDTNDDVGFSIDESIDSGYVVAGFTQNFGTQPYSDIYIIKTDSMGISECNGNNTTTTITHPHTQTGFMSVDVLTTNLTIAPSSPILNTGGSVNILCSTTNISETQIPQPEIIIYPNPASNQFTITSNEFAIKEFVIYNLLGEKVFSEQLNTKYKTVDTKLPQGIYFVRVNDVVRKLVIE